MNWIAPDSCSALSVVLRISDIKLETLVIGFDELQVRDPNSFVMEGSSEHSRSRLSFYQGDPSATNV